MANNGLNGLNNASSGGSKQPMPIFARNPQLAATVASAWAREHLKGKKSILTLEEDISTKDVLGLLKENNAKLKTQKRGYAKNPGVLSQIFNSKDTPIRPTRIVTPRQTSGARPNTNGVLNYFNPTRRETQPNKATQQPAQNAAQVNPQSPVNPATQAVAASLNTSQVLNATQPTPRVEAAPIQSSGAVSTDFSSPGGYVPGVRPAPSNPGSPQSSTESQYDYINKATSGKYDQYNDPFFGVDGMENDIFSRPDVFDRGFSYYQPIARKSRERALAKSIFDTYDKRGVLTREIDELETQRNAYKERGRKRMLSGVSDEIDFLKKKRKKKRRPFGYIWANRRLDLFAFIGKLLTDLGMDYVQTKVQRILVGRLSNFIAKRGLRGLETSLEKYAYKNAQELSRFYKGLQLYKDDFVLKEAAKVYKGRAATVGRLFGKGAENWYARRTGLKLFEDTQLLRNASRQRLSPRAIRARTELAKIWERRFQIERIENFLKKNSELVLKNDLPRYGYLRSGLDWIVKTEYYRSAVLGTGRGKWGALSRATYTFKKAGILGGIIRLTAAAPVRLAYHLSNFLISKPSSKIFQYGAKLLDDYAIKSDQIVFKQGAKLLRTMDRFITGITTKKINQLSALIRSKGVLRGSAKWVTSIPREYASWLSRIDHPFFKNVFGVFAGTRLRNMILSNMFFRLEQMMPKVFGLKWVRNIFGKLAADYYTAAQTGAKVGFFRRLAVGTVKLPFRAVWGTMKFMGRGIGMAFGAFFGGTAAAGFFRGFGAGIRAILKNSRLGKYVDDIATRVGGGGGSGILGVGGKWAGRALLVTGIVGSGFTIFGGSAAINDYVNNSIVEAENFANPKASCYFEHFGVGAGIKESLVGGALNSVNRTLTQNFATELISGAYTTDPNDYVDTLKYSDDGLGTLDRITLYYGYKLKDQDKYNKDCGFDTSEYVYAVKELRVESELVLPDAIKADYKRGGGWEIGVQEPLGRYPLLAYKTEDGTKFGWYSYSTVPGTCENPVTETDFEYPAGTTRPDGTVSDGTKKVCHYTGRNFDLLEPRGKEIYRADITFKDKYNIKDLGYPLKVNFYAGLTIDRVKRSTGESKTFTYITEPAYCREFRLDLPPDFANYTQYCNQSASTNPVTNNPVVDGLVCPFENKDKTLRCTFPFIPSTHEAIDLAETADVNVARNLKLFTPIGGKMRILRAYTPGTNQVDPIYPQECGQGVSIRIEDQVEYQFWHIALDPNIEAEILTSPDQVIDIAQGTYIGNYFINDSPPGTFQNGQLCWSGNHIHYVKNVRKPGEFGSVSPESDINASCNVRLMCPGSEDKNR